MNLWKILRGIGMYLMLFLSGDEEFRLERGLQDLSLASLYGVQSEAEQARILARLEMIRMARSTR